MEEQKSIHKQLFTG